MAGSVAHADMEIENIVPYRAVLTVTCHVGASFADGSTQRTFVCGLNGTWSTGITGCAGKMVAAACMLFKIKLV